VTAAIVIDVPHVSVEALTVRETGGAGGGLVARGSAVNIAIAIFIQLLVTIIAHGVAIVVEGKTDSIMAAAVIPGVAPVLGGALTIFVAIDGALVSSNARGFAVSLTITILIAFDMSVAAQGETVIVIKSAHVFMAAVIIVTITQIYVHALAVIISVAGARITIMAGFLAVSIAITILTFLPVAIVAHCRAVIINGRTHPSVTASVIKGVATILDGATTIFRAVYGAFIGAGAGGGAIGFAITILIPFDVAVTT